MTYLDIKFLAGVIYTCWGRDRLRSVGKMFHRFLDQERCQSVYEEYKILAARCPITKDSIYTLHPGA